MLMHSEDASSSGGPAIILWYRRLASTDCRATPSTNRGRTELGRAAAGGRLQGPSVNRGLSGGEGALTEQKGRQRPGTMAAATRLLGERPRADDALAERMERVSSLRAPKGTEADRMTLSSIRAHAQRRARGHSGSITGASGVPCAARAIESYQGTIDHRAMCEHALNTPPVVTGQSATPGRPPHESAEKGSC